jgi:hypothetical protein
MLSAILIFALSITALAAAWSLLGPRRQNTDKSREGIRDPVRYHQQSQELDLQILRALLDANEFHYLRRSLTREDFKDLLRKRICLTFTMLRLLEDKIDRTVAVERLAAAKSNRELAPRAEALLATTVQLRFNLLRARLCLCLQWLLPSETLSLPHCFRPYQDLLNTLERRGVLASV